MQVTRRQFFKICSGGMAGTTLATLGFAPGAALADVRAYKLLRARETRNTCPYCSVGCGLLMYSRSDGAGNVKESIFHIEGDPDHPVSRGALCPKGAGLGSPALSGSTRSGQQRVETDQLGRSA